MISSRFIRTPGVLPPQSCKEYFFPDKYCNHSRPHVWCFVFIFNTLKTQLGLQPVNHGPSDLFLCISNTYNIWRSAIPPSNIYILHLLRHSNIDIHTTLQPFYVLLSFNVNQKDGWIYICYYQKVTDVFEYFNSWLRPIYYHPGLLPLFLCKTQWIIHQTWGYPLMLGVSLSSIWILPHPRNVYYDTPLFIIILHPRCCFFFLWVEIRYAFAFPRQNRWQFVDSFWTNGYRQNPPPRCVRFIRA